jgi:phasin family protein
MTYFAEQLMATNQANVHALRRLSIQTYGGVQRLVEWNFVAAMAGFANCCNPTQAFLGAQNAQQLMLMQFGLVRPLTQKSIEYSRDVCTIVHETYTGLTSTSETSPGLGSACQPVETST